MRTYSSTEGKVLLNWGPTLVPVLAVVFTVPALLYSIVTRAMRFAFTLNLS